MMSQLTNWLNESGQCLILNSVRVNVENFLDNRISITSWIRDLPLRRLDSTNSSLPEGSYLFADKLSGLFILLQNFEAPKEILCIFESDDVETIYVDLSPSQIITLAFKKMSDASNVSLTLGTGMLRHRPVLKWLMEFLASKLQYIEPT